MNWLRNRLAWWRLRLAARGMTPTEQADLLDALEQMDD